MLAPRIDQVDLGPHSSQGITGARNGLRLEDPVAIGVVQGYQRSLPSVRGSACGTIGSCYATVTPSKGRRFLVCKSCPVMGFNPVTAAQEGPFRPCLIRVRGHRDWVIDRLNFMQATGLFGASVDP